MRKMLFYLAPIALLAGVACKKNQSVAAQQTISPVVGEWIWVQQTNAIGVNGFPFDTLTPKTTDTTGVLDILQDGSWSWTVNSQAIDAGVFDIDSGLTPGGRVASLVFNGSNGKFLTFIGSQHADSIVNHMFSPNSDTLYISNTLYVNAYTVTTFVSASASGTTTP
jgi:hypothetical protein